MIAPHKSNRKLKTQDGRRLRRYARRWIVERFFAWLQWKRRLLVRWEHVIAGLVMKRSTWRWIASCAALMGTLAGGWGLGALAFAITGSEPIGFAVVIPTWFVGFWVTRALWPTVRAGVAARHRSCCEASGILSSLHFGLSKKPSCAVYPRDDESDGALHDCSVRPNRPAREPLQCRRSA
jgi:hypothetical protein